MLSSRSQIKGYFTETFLGPETYITDRPGQINEEQYTEEIRRLPTSARQNKLDDPNQALGSGENTAQESSAAVCNIP